MPVDPQWIILLVLQVPLFEKTIADIPCSNYCRFSAFVFGMTLWAFAAMHAYYILKNQTTIEHISDRIQEVRVDFDVNGNNYEVVSTHYNEKLWDLGGYDNWRAVMGSNPWGWFCR